MPSEAVTVTVVAVLQVVVAGALAVADNAITGSEIVTGIAAELHPKASVITIL